jgi:hypothetical protein
MIAHLAIDKKQTTDHTGLSSMARAHGIDSTLRFRRRNRTPADWFPIGVGKHADWNIPADERIERLREFPGRFLLAARHPPSHAGAIAKFAVLVREDRQVP